MTKKVIIPWELKADFRMTGWASILKGWLYGVREKFGADEALEMWARISKMGDRHKNITNKILTIFKIEGNDAETIANWFNIWWELTGIEATWLERSTTIARCKITKCPFKTDYIDISDWDLTVFMNNVAKSINQKVAVEQMKNMCAGDSFCEFIFKIEE